VYDLSSPVVLRDRDRGIVYEIDDDDEEADISTNNTNIIQNIDPDEDITESSKHSIDKLLTEEEEHAKERETENERLYHMFLQAERAQNQCNVDKQKYRCGICMSDDLDLSEMITLSCQPKGHRICCDCMNAYCCNKIQDAEISRKELVCPEVGCSEPITIHEVCSFLLKLYVLPTNILFLI
jgi:hypothetical protein